MTKNASPASDHQNGLGGRRGQMLVLSSPSGAGKTSISRRLLAEDDDLGTKTSASSKGDSDSEA